MKISRHLRIHFQGARWDVDMNSIADSRLKELHPEMPVMSLKAITQDKQDRGNLYECPVYKTRERGEFFQVTVKLGSLINHFHRSDIHLDVQSENKRQTLKMGIGWSGTAAPDLKRNTRVYKLLLA